MELLEAIEARTAKVCVLGLGYVGLPVARRAAECGYQVWGVDTDLSRVELLSADSSAPDRSVNATTDPSVVGIADIVLICVPTPLNQDLPDTRHIEEAGRAVSAYLRRGQLVILESTSYPGTTDELLKKILEESGLRAGEDFLLGFSPERIDPGNRHYGLTNTPKLVGGIDEASSRVMSAFYSTLVEEVVQVSSPAVAEMAKLLENTYRHVNIALANEMAILCDDLGLDVWEVIDAASTKPFGFEPFYPGPGWGGHCIPVDPSYLSWRVKEMGQTARFVELATEFNRRMPGYVVERVAEALAGSGKGLAGASILVIGVSYKPGSGDCRNSPAIEILDRLQEGGAKVGFSDPHVASLEIGTTKLASEDLTPALLSAADLVLLHTAHPTLDPNFIAAHASLVFDTRNFFRGVRGNIVRL